MTTLARIDSKRGVGVISLVLRCVGAASLLAFGVVAYTPAPNLVDRVFSAPARVEPADAVIVLGAGGVRADGTLSDTSLRRTLYGIALYRRGLAPLLVLSGPASAGGLVEADVRSALAREAGVPPTAIVVEATARTTREEASRMSALLRPRGVRRVLLVVDSQGAYRAARLFERSGLDPLLAPADDVAPLDDSPEGRLALARRLAIEMVALAYYRAAGYL